MLLAPPVEVSNGYQSPPSLPSVFPLPQPCSKDFLLHSFHSLVLSLQPRWAWYVDDPIEIPRTRWRSFAAIPRETIWPFPHQDPFKGIFFGAPTAVCENPNLQMPHTIWTLYIALTKKKCMKGKCNEKVGFHYKLWIESQVFRHVWMGKTYCNVGKPRLSASQRVLDTPYLRRSPWKLEYDAHAMPKQIKPGKEGFTM